MVRKTSLFFRAAMAAALLLLIVPTSCNVSEDGRRFHRAETPISFTASRDIALDLSADRKEDAGRTKATLGSDGSVIWSADDSISVFTSDATRYLYDCKELINEGLSAVFEGDAPSGDSYAALYPAQNAASFDSKNNLVSAVLPSVQNAVAGGFDPAASLAVAQSSGSELSFKNVCALVNFVVRDDNVKVITLSGNAASDSTALAGGAEIDFNDGNPAANVTLKKDAVRLEGDFVKGQRYYMVVFPGTYNDLQLVFTDATGRTATFSNPVALTLERNSNINLFDQEIPEAKWLAPAVSMAATIEVAADGASAESSSVEFFSVEGWDVAVTYDGCVEYAYYDSDIESVVYSVGKNSTSKQRTGTITVTVSKYGFKSVSATANVVQEAGASTTDTNWYLVTSTAGLVAGDEYVMVSKAAGVIATDIPSNEQYLGVENVTFSADTTYISTLPAKALILTLGGKADAWTLSNSDTTKLGATTTKKLAWDTGTTTWQITIDGAGNATIQSSTSTYGRFQYNDGAPRFTTYKSSTTLKPVQLYHRSGKASTSVNTSAASEITTSAATLSGSYYCATAVPSEAGILYGTDAASLNSKSTSATPSSKASTIEVRLTDLYPSTTYYYKAYVVENGVTYSGAILSFNTNSSGGGTQTSGGADYGWPELPAQTDKDSNGIDDNNSDYYYSHTFRADASTIRNFSCCYSKSKIHPVWVAAPMHKCYLGSSGRNDSYKADPNIKCTQNGKFDGYTRGHMVGSSDRTVSVATNRQAFYYSNIGAQLSSGFNTGGGVWNNLEDRVDGYLCADTLYQVIGCIFDPFTDHYGESQGKRTASGSTIPTAYYKALLRTKSGSTGKDVRNCTADELQCVAFIVIHNSNNHKREPSSKDMYSIAELEAMTGLTFFVNVPNAPKNTYKASDWGM